MKVIAHRGASWVEPENTLPAFRRAAEQGADWVELDVRRGLLVSHDPLPATRPPTVPTLAEALEACAPLQVNVEIKDDPADPDHRAGDGFAAEVAHELARLGWTDRVLVSSFQPSALAEVRRADPRLGTAWLTAVPSGPAAMVEAAVGGAHLALHPWAPLVTAELVDLAHARGLAVHPWTVDDPARMVELIDLGVDGICTNRPDRLRALLDGR